ncbi:hypothetical protein MPSEU_000666500 [Mayamaea pseudoterrestris]|nr:hypothetical protein MPSEU_000666500 [Mayamaea pseudoterrestris]
MTYQHSLIASIFLVLACWTLSLHAQNFDCADQSQAFSFCALTNQSSSALNECFPCVYIQFPEDPTFDCSAYNGQVCGLVQTNCTDACPLDICADEFNAWLTCAADHPRRCNVTCDFTTEDSTSDEESGVNAGFHMVRAVLVGVLCAVVGAASVWL